MTATRQAHAHVAVVGGGLAGITAAIALAETGAQITLLESRPRLGGATSSFSRGGLTIDNGQHVFLRCCTAYRGLLARLGMTGSVAVQDRFDVTVLRPGGRARLRRTALPGPLHMGQALARYRHLSNAERLLVVPAAHHRDVRVCLRGCRHRAALISWPPSGALRWLREAGSSPPGHRNGARGCVVPKARRLALCGVRPGGCGVALPVCFTGPPLVLRRVSAAGRAAAAPRRPAI